MTRARVVVATLGMLVLVACGGNANHVEWRDLELTLPMGWVVIDELGDALYIGNGQGGDEPGDPGDLTVGIQFSTEDAPSIDDWRTLVAERDGEVEVDTSTELGGLPASVLQFTLPGRNDVVPDTRERVITVPSRDLVLLAQAVPLRGQADGGQLFLDDLDEIEQLLDSIAFGAPLDQ